jgi:hypothetical protein
VLQGFPVARSRTFGAIANSFFSFYLWQHDKAFRDWLVRGGYKIVTDPFGRFEIETFFALDADAFRAGARAATSAGGGCD